MPAPTLQFKRGNAGVAGTVPALRPGEPAISLNNFDFFIGIDSSVVNNKFFGSHRYWGREDGTNSLRLKLVDKNGTNYISIKSPDTLVGFVTYTLPGTQGTVSSVLTNDGSGNLTWSSGSANPVFTGIATFTDTTDNVLGNSNTGAVQIDGGLGIDKNVTVGANLNVQGYSRFVGIATFSNVKVVNDLTVDGNFYVNGTTTEVNTTSLTVEDRTIELGVVDGSSPITSTTWDLGVLFNYYTDSAKKSAIVWEHSDSRFKLGSVISDSGGTGSNNPQITVSSFAALEISDLWINNTCTGGAQQVIGCIGSELELQNITVDAGYY